MNIDDVNVIHFIDFIKKPDYYYLVVELCDSDLRSVLKKQKTISEA